ncbi:unnamed protein product [Effrenium voratum]|nr:unnamed protein product [Effrenium voratum]
MTGPVRETGTSGAFAARVIGGRAAETNGSKRPRLGRGAFAGLNGSRQDSDTQAQVPKPRTAFVRPKPANTTRASAAADLATDSARDFTLWLQGSGPHFCPGGNPHNPGAALFQATPYAMFLAVLRLKGLGLVAALHGFVLGGGLAMAMLAELRAIDRSASVCLGNLSRGMVPCMLLSLLLPGIGLLQAMDLYLTDDVLPAAAWQELSLDFVADGPHQAKAMALQLARRRACGQGQGLGRLGSDCERFSREAAALQLSLRCERPFAPSPASAAPALAASTQAAPALALESPASHLVFKAASR